MRTAPSPTTLPPGSDEVLARLVATRAGERAFRALYERYHLPLYRYCHSIVGSEADAQDALQSTFTKAFVALREGKRKAPLRPWLYRIAHNESVSLLRAGRATLPQAQIASAREHEPSAEERASERARLRLLLSDLSQLAERARAALVMRELGGLSHEEIATALEVSVGAAKQAIFEARSALLELEQGRAMPCDEVRRKLSDADRRTLRGRKLRAHLRDCPSCAAFAVAIPARQEQLRALAPALPAVAAGAVLAHALQGSSLTSGTGATSGGSTVAGAIKAAAALATPKALFATAVVAGVAASASGLVAGSSAGHASHGARAGSARALRAVPADRTRAGSGQGSAHTGHRSAPTGPATHPSAHARPTRPSTTTHRPGSGPPAKHHPASSPGKSGNADSRTGQPPGLTKHNHTPPGLSRHDHTPPGQAKHMS